MLKVRPISDLHLEFWNSTRPGDIDTLITPLDTDKDTVLAIAGDLGLLHRGETWLSVLKYWATRFKAVVYVAGNHEFYHNNYFDRVDMLVKEMKIPSNVFLLENDTVQIDDVLFIGASLWTDMNDCDELTMRRAYNSMTDYRCMKWETGHYVQVIDTVNQFNYSKKFIFELLDRYKGEKNYVLTHHLPSYTCVSPRFQGDNLNAAFATELGPEIAITGPTVWHFGHTHDSHESVLGDTRLICNPYGYRAQEVNPKFNKELILEL
jgi:predicted phosphodiesterase